MGGGGRERLRGPSERDRTATARHTVYKTVIQARVIQVGIHGIETARESEQKPKQKKKRSKNQKKQEQKTEIDHQRQ